MVSRHFVFVVPASVKSELKAAAKKGVVSPKLAQAALAAPKAAAVARTQLAKNGMGPLAKAAAAGAPGKATMAVTNNVVIDLQGDGATLTPDGRVQDAPK
jgi:hypothetical protein